LRRTSGTGREIIARMKLLALFAALATAVPGGAGRHPCRIDLAALTHPAPVGRCVHSTNWA